MFAVALVPLLLLFAQDDQDLQAAIKALDADQPAVAEPLLRKAVAARPDDYFVHFNLALALSLQNKDDEAIAEFRTTLKQSPGLYEADLNLGMVLMRAKRPAEALEVLREAVAAKPDNPTANFYYADALLQTGSADEALERFKQVANADPKSARAQFGIARALTAQGKRAEAEPFYRAAADLDADYRDRIPVVVASGGPSEYDLALNKAKELRDAHQPRAALQQFLAASRLKPDAPEPWREAAALLISAKNFPQGLQALDRAKALAPETPGQLFYRAIALDSLKQKKPAAEAYGAFLAAAQGKFPDQEFQARQRMRIIEEEIKRGLK